MSANANLSLHRNKLQESRIASSKQSRHSTKSAKTNHHHGGGYSSTDNQDDRLIFVDDDFAPNASSPDSTDDDPLIFVDDDVNPSTSIISYEEVDHDALPSASAAEMDVSTSASTSATNLEHDDLKAKATDYLDQSSISTAAAQQSPPPTFNITSPDNTLTPIILTIDDLTPPSSYYNTNPSSPLLEADSISELSAENNLEGLTQAQVSGSVSNSSDGQNYMEWSRAGFVVVAALLFVFAVVRGRNRYQYLRRLERGEEEEEEEVMFDDLEAAGLAALAVADQDEQQDETSHENHGSSIMSSIWSANDEEGQVYDDEEDDGFDDESFIGDVYTDDDEDVDDEDDEEDHTFEGLSSPQEQYEQEVVLQAVVQEIAATAAQSPSPHSTVPTTAAAAAATRTSTTPRMSTPRAFRRKQTPTPSSTGESGGSRVSGVAAMAAMGMRAIKLYSSSPNTRARARDSINNNIAASSSSSEEEEEYPPNDEKIGIIEQASSLEGESSDDLRCDNFETPTKDVRDPYPAWWAIGSC